MLTATIRKLDQDESRRMRVFGLISALILIARFPEGLLHAELWAEDGWVFYPDAYVHGVRSFLLPHGGYLNTIQRLGALLAVWTHLPLLWLPTFFLLFGLSMQLAVALFLLGNRLALLWPDWRARSAFALLYLCLPNSNETYGTLTNSQWHLMLLAFLVVVAPPAASVGWRIFDGAVLLFSGLSGPFSLLMVPLGLVNCYRYRREASARFQMILRLGLLSVAACVQVFFVFGMHNARNVGGLGATVARLTQIVAHQVVLGLLLGFRTLVQFQHKPVWHMLWLSALVSSTAILLLIAAFVRGGFLFRAFSVYGLVLFAIELSSPVASQSVPQWQAFTVPGTGQRYYLVPMLVFASALFTLAAQPIKRERLVGIAGLALIFFWSIPADFIHIRWQRTNYDAKARAFDKAPPGTRGSFPEHPTGAYDMVLIKK